MSPFFNDDDYVLVRLIVGYKSITIMLTPVKDGLCLPVQNIHDINEITIKIILGNSISVKLQFKNEQEKVFECTILGNLNK